MERKIGSGIILPVLLISTLMLIFNIQSVQTASNTIVVPDDYPTIQGGINAAVNGDTVYVKSGTYYEDLVVNKSVSLVGENKESTTVVGSAIAVIQVTVDNVTIEGFTIAGYAPHEGLGIALNSVKNNAISGNKIVTERAGILLEGSSKNRIENNSIRGSLHGNAIDLHNSPDNAIVGNSITSSVYGISLTASPNNVIDGNVVTDCPTGVSFDSSSNNIIIKNNGITRAQYSISSFSSNISISQNVIEGDVDIRGVNVDFMRNNITGGMNGLILTASNSNVIENQVTGCDSGMSVGGSNNRIIGNNITANNVGLALGGSSNNISRNHVALNMYGVSFGGSSSNVYENDVVGNWEGFELDGGSDNKIYHNNFRDNVQLFSSYGSSTNIWDDSYPSGGNYWSDFAVRYPDAHELDDSGIWDTQYVIDENNRDRYPLMSPWTPTPPIPPIVTPTVDIDPDTLNLRSEGQWITVYIQLPEEYSAADINASTILLNGAVSPVLNLKYGFVTNPNEYLVDHNGDGILERMVKFDRATVETWIYHNQGIRRSNVALTLTGELLDGTIFEGSDTIFVDYAGDANNDGIINIADFAVISAHWYPGPPIGPLGYDESVDFNKDGKVDILEVAAISANWELTVPPKGPLAP